VLLSICHSDGLEKQQTIKPQIGSFLTSHNSIIMQSPARPLLLSFPTDFAVLKHLAVGTPRLERNDSRDLLPARPPMRF
jgi:hypothetical protein